MYGRVISKKRKAKVSSRKRIARSSSKNLTQKERKKLFERGRHNCEACGKKIEFLDMHAGHKISKANGGGGSLRNRVCLCYTCNNNMGKQNYRQYMKFMGYKIPSYMQR
jgi:5-methylcytosine-specific restriction endonuclease McrA